MPIRISNSWDAFGFSNFCKIMNHPIEAVTALLDLMLMICESLQIQYNAMQNTI